MSDLPRILIVDNSRVVRAGLAKHLQGRFEVREETNGEAAWQTLVLDSRIVAVISGLQMQKLDGYGLVERLRESRLHRLREMPFLLIISDTECEQGMARAKSHGVSDCITKLMCKAEILKHLTSLTNPPVEIAGKAVEEQDGDFSENDIDSSAILKRVGRLSEFPADDPKEHLPVIEAQVHLLTGSEIEAKITKALTDSKNRKALVSVLALGIDNYEALLERFGRNVAEGIGGRFAKLVGGKIGLRDSVGLYRPDCCVIVSREASIGRCYTFAGRICRSMATAQIAVRGQPVGLAICAGAASVPEDGAMSASELLALAIKRMEATRCSCNRSQRERGQEATGEHQEIPALRSLAAMLANHPEIVEPHLGTVGLQLLPLLSMLEREFRFGLPLPEIESRLAERARQEEELAQ